MSMIQIATSTARQLSVHGASNAIHLSPLDQISPVECFVRFGGSREHSGAIENRHPGHERQISGSSLQTLGFGGVTMQRLAFIGVWAFVICVLVFLEGVDYGMNNCTHQVQKK